VLSCVDHRRTQRDRLSQGADIAKERDITNGVGILGHEDIFEEATD